MDCFKFNIYDLNINENYLYPALGFCGLAITYLGNKFIKPTLFIGGTILSSTGSYKLTEFVLKELSYNNCNIIYVTTGLMSISGGFIALKLYKVMNFILGFLTGTSIGYLLYISLLYKICLGIYFIYDNMFWLSTLIPGFLGGIITHYKEKELSIILTSLIGPILIVIPTKELIEKKNLVSENFIKFIIYFFIYMFFSLTGFKIQKKRINDRSIQYKSPTSYQLSI